MLDWKKHKLESRLPGEISIASDMQMTPPLWQTQRDEAQTLATMWVGPENMMHFSDNAGLEETQAGIKIAWRNINSLRYADDTTLMAESEEKLDRKSTRLNSSHTLASRMPSSA